MMVVVSIQQRNLLLGFVLILASVGLPAFARTKTVERERFMKDGVVISVLQKVEDGKEKNCCLYIQNKNRGARGFQCKYLVECETNDIPVLMEKSARGGLYPRSGTWRAMGENERYVKMTYFDLGPVGSAPAIEGTANSASSNKGNAVSPAQQNLHQSVSTDK
jgi:hypothetical protein